MLTKFIWPGPQDRSAGRAAGFAVGAFFYISHLCWVFYLVSQLDTCNSHLWLCQLSGSDWNRKILFVFQPHPKCLLRTLHHPHPSQVPPKSAGKTPFLIGAWRALGYSSMTQKNSVYQPWMCICTIPEIVCESLCFLQAPKWCQATEAEAELFIEVSLVFKRFAKRGMEGQYRDLTSIQLTLIGIFNTSLESQVSPQS